VTADHAPHDHAPHDDELITAALTGTPVAGQPPLDYIEGRARALRRRCARGVTGAAMGAVAAVAGAALMLPSLGGDAAPPPGQESDEQTSGGTSSITTSLLEDGSVRIAVDDAALDRPRMMRSLFESLGEHGITAGPLSEHCLAQEVVPLVGFTEPLVEYDVTVDQTHVLVVSPQRLEGLTLELGVADLHEDSRETTDRMIVIIGGWATHYCIPVVSPLP
jgi:hypothetical protein